jgi:hypothetical protein
VPIQRSSRRIAARRVSMLARSLLEVSTLCAIKNGHAAPPGTRQHGVLRLHE